MAYQEPPMKFNVALKKYVPDLPPKSRKSDAKQPEHLWIIPLVVGIIILLLVLVEYYSRS